MSELLESFRESYRNLELLPLATPEDLERFRVDYGTEVIEKLEQLVEDSPSGDGKIIFAGHRGCGKSTLLAEFSRQLEERYFVVFFSISDLIEMSDVNHINILFAIAVQLMAEAEKRQVKIKDSIKTQFYKWFASRTRIETEQYNAETTAGFDLFKILTGKLKADATVRNEIKEEFKQKVSDLVARINEMAVVVNQATQKEILVIIDDLDKLDLALVQEIFNYHIKALFQPNFRIILTIPIAALREMFLREILITETNNQIVTMPVAKLFSKGDRHQPDAVPRPEPTAILTEMLQKRISDRLIDPETLEQIIIYSGGVLRELIRITNECCRICLRLIRRQPDNPTIKIDQTILEQAIIELRMDFDMGIGTADYEILKTTYFECRPSDPKEQRFLNLLHGLYVLEYRNAEQWYDVHPLVTDLLKLRGYI